MGVKTHTTYEYRCTEDKCRFTRTFDTKKEANETERRHKHYHEQFQVGAKVLVPFFPQYKTGEPGRVTTVWFDMEEAVVTLDEKRDCHKCADHPHQYTRFWRGKLLNLVVGED